MSASIESAVDNKMRVALGISIVSLLLSGLSLFVAMTDDVDAGRIEARLACLELPGPNDCRDR